MLFNSSVFALFLIIVFILYWFVCKRIKTQNVLLFFASLFFYGWWDWRFLSLILLISGIDFFLSIKISNNNNQKTRKALLITSIILNLSILFVFKYLNFFIESFNILFQAFGFHTKTLSIILPLGISFYTFQTMSYTIDVYRNKLQATKDFISFGAYISFFPQLVAGPIERAINLLPQFSIQRVFNKTFALEGLKIMLWGFFKKIVIADGIAVIIDPILNEPHLHSGGTLAIAGFLFAIQIYADFSGYSEIAIGTARLFGFTLMKNFNYPYFATSIVDFWRRWHISLTSWFKDYVYIPLGGSKNGLKMHIINTGIVFLISGLWHGANYTFILWGLANALLFVPHIFFKSHTSKFKLLKILITNVLVIVLWFMFRANTINELQIIYSKIFSSDIIKLSVKIPLYIYIVISFLLLIEWIGKSKDFAIVYIANSSTKFMRWTFYYIIIFAIFYYYKTPQAYIYFQF